jgi:outer membrane protein assembly factor BamB
MPVQLFNTTIDGQLTQVVGAGSKDGYYYEINAASGQLIYKTSLGIHANDNSPPTPSGSIIYPGSFGGVNTFSSFDPVANMIYTMAYNYPSDFFSSPITLNGEGGAGNDVQRAQINSTLYAIGASTGGIVWSRTFQGLCGGASSTNDIIFTSDGLNNYYALDARNGSTLWSYTDESGGFEDGLANWGPPAIVDGMVFETSLANNGGVLAFVLSSNASLGALQSANTIFGSGQAFAALILGLLFISTAGSNSIICNSRYQLKREV